MKILTALCLLAALATATPAAAVTKKAAQAKPHAPAGQVPTGTVDVPGKIITEPNAFHGTKWGTPLTAVPDIVVVEKAGQAAYAAVPGVVYRIGDAFMDNVVYGFCQDKFAAVMVEFKGRKAFESVKKFLTGKYTPPVELGGNADSLGWPIGNVLIRMEFEVVKDLGTLSYFYQPLYAPCNETLVKAKP